MRSPPDTTQRPLAQLLAYINGVARGGASDHETVEPAKDALATGEQAADTGPGKPDGATTDNAVDTAAHLRASYPELPLLHEFKTRWIQLSANRQLERAQEQVPENAGPLHSSRLVTRSLALMDTLSPAYLHTFMAYVDALSWTEQFMSSRDAAQEAARAANAKAAAGSKDVSAAGKSGGTRKRRAPSKGSSAAVVKDAEAPAPKKRTSAKSAKTPAPAADQVEPGETET